MMPNGCLVCYQHGGIVVLKEGFIINRFSLFQNKKERFIGKNRYLYRLLRLGIRTAEVIDNNQILLSVRNIIYEFDLLNGALSEGWSCGTDVRPLVFSKVKDVTGFDNGIYFGEYKGIMFNQPVNVYKRISIDNWQVVYTFPKGVINHVHNIVADPYRQCLWILTGDFDEAAAIWKVTDNFRKVERVAYNDQRYRGCVAFALPEGLLYATDAPYAENYIYLLNPETMKTQELYSIHGSSIYGCQWKDRYVFSSTVEGDGRNMSRWEFCFSRKRGAGIKDNYVHLYIGNLNEGFHEVYKEKKDWLPYYTFQFGAFRFPYGINNTDTLYFQPIATTENDLGLLYLYDMDLKLCQAVVNKNS